MNAAKRRTMVTATEAGKKLDVSRQAIHYHIHNSEIYTESFGIDDEGRPALYLVDLDELREVIRPKATEPVP